MAEEEKLAEQADKEKEVWRKMLEHFILSGIEEGDRFGLVSGRSKSVPGRLGMITLARESMSRGNSASPAAKLFDFKINARILV